MNAAEAAVLLARISANDNREVSEAAARAWAETLPDIALADALEYLPTFYREATRDSKNWIYPGDVLRGVHELLRQRRSDYMGAARERFLAEADDPDDAEIQLLAHRAVIEAMKEWDAQFSLPELPPALKEPERKPAREWQR